MIASWFAFADQGERFPETLPVPLQARPTTLRYGENPHQSAALYTCRRPGRARHRARPSRCRARN